jgi:hypothetical protein
MKSLLRVLAAATALTFSLQATVISGSITDLTGQIQTSNRTVRFVLENCGNNLPTVVGSSVIVPASVTLAPNAAGNLAGTLVGNDIISCGTTIGQIKIR